jgi:hypothetical protein
MKGFTIHDLDVIAQVLKILSFKENDDIARQGDVIDYFGIFVHGQA